MSNSSIRVGAGDESRLYTPNSYNEETLFCEEENNYSPLESNQGLSERQLQAGMASAGVIALRESLKLANLSVAEIEVEIMGLEQRVAFIQQLQKDLSGLSGVTSAEQKILSELSKLTQTINELNELKSAKIGTDFDINFDAPSTSQKLSPNDQAKIRLENQKFIRGIKVNKEIYPEAAKELERTRQALFAEEMTAIQRPDRMRPPTNSNGVDEYACSTKVLDTNKTTIDNNQYHNNQLKKNSGDLSSGRNYDYRLDRAQKRISSNTAEAAPSTPSVEITLDGVSEELNPTPARSRGMIDLERGGIIAGSDKASPETALLNRASKFSPSAGQYWSKVVEPLKKIVGPVAKIIPPLAVANSGHRIYQHNLKPLNEQSVTDFTSLAGGTGVIGGGIGMLFKAAWGPLALAGGMSVEAISDGFKKLEKIQDAERSLEPVSQKENIGSGMEISGGAVGLLALTPLVSTVPGLVVAALMYGGGNLIYEKGREESAAMLLKEHLNTLVMIKNTPASSALQPIGRAIKKMGSDLDDEVSYAVVKYLHEQTYTSEHGVERMINHSLLKEPIFPAIDYEGEVDSEWLDKSILEIFENQIDDFWVSDEDEEALKWIQKAKGSTNQL